MTEHSAPPSDGQAAPGPGRDEQPHPSRPPLKRSDSHRVVAGVCGGVGRHLDIDPVVFRVVIAVLCLSGGVGLFIYGMAWLIIPVERTGQNELQRLLSGKVDWQSLGAVLVTVLGTGIFFSYMGSTGHIFPLLLIALLAFAALRYDPEAFDRRRQAQPSAAQTPASAAATVLPTDATTEPAPAWWQRPDPLLKKPGGTAAAAGTTPGPAAPSATPGPPTAPTVPLWALPQDQPLPPEPDRAGPEAPAPPRPPRPAPPRRERSYLGTIFFCLAVITSGAVWLIGERLHHGADLLAVLSSGLLVLGLGLLLGARWGRARSLVLWGALLTLVVAAVAASPVQLRTTYQHVNWAPAATSSVPPSYRLSTGAATLDLSSVAPGAGRTVTTRVTLGAGALTVRLPSGPEVHVHVRVGVGALELPGGTDTGGVSVTRTVDLDPGGAAAHGTIDLDISVGAGQAEVIQ